MTGHVEGEAIAGDAVLSDMIAGPEVKAIAGRAAHSMVDKQVLEPFTRVGCLHRALVELVGGKARSSRWRSTDRRWLLRNRRTAGDTECLFHVVPGPAVAELATCSWAVSLPMTDWGV
jgi:hypothetical protein